MRVVIIGDVFVPGSSIAEAILANPAIECDSIEVADWEIEGGGPAIHALQHQIELNGPAAVPIPPQLTALARTADLLVVHFLPVAADILTGSESLTTVIVARAGTENVDDAAADQAGVAVVNIAGRNAPAVAEMTLALILTEMRNISRAHLSISVGGWRKDFVSRSKELGGCTVGLIGYGNVARMFVRLLSGFDVTVLAYDPYTPPSRLAEDGVIATEIDPLFARADVVAVFARLTTENERFIGATLLGSMKPTAYFVNTARSRLVDYDALYDALASHSIAGAGLDVFDEEPLPLDSPWRTLDNVTLTSHFAGDTPESFARSGVLVADALARLLATESSCYWE